MSETDWKVGWRVRYCDALGNTREGVITKTAPLYGDIIRSTYVQVREDTDQQSWRWVRRAQLTRIPREWDCEARGEPPRDAVWLDGDGRYLHPTRDNHWAWSTDPRASVLLDWEWGYAHGSSWRLREVLPTDTGPKAAEAPAVREDESLEEYQIRLWSEIKRLRRDGTLCGEADDELRNLGLPDSNATRYTVTLDLVVDGNVYRAESCLRNALAAWGPALVVSMEVKYRRD